MTLGRMDTPTIPPPASLVEDKSKSVLALALGLMSIKGEFEPIEFMTILEEDCSFSREEAIETIARLEEQRWLRHTGKNKSIKYTLGKLR